MKGWLLAIALLGPVESLDASLQRAVQESRAPALERPMRLASDIGKPMVVVGAVAAILVFDRAAGARTALTMLATLAPVNLVVETTKRLTFRTRPDGERKRSNASFPSSHAANAFAIAVVLSRRWRRVAPAFLAAAAVVAYSRVYLNRHYVSDVVVGALVGVGGAFLGAWIVARWRARREVPQSP